VTLFRRKSSQEQTAALCRLVPAGDIKITNTEVETMGRLKQLGPLVEKLKPRVAYADAGKSPMQMREQNAPWLGWYRLQRWRRLRWQILVRDNFTCKLCGKLEGDSSQLVADHVKAHRGNVDLFWDPNNLQALCKACHNSTKQAEDQASRMTRGVWY
jgi:5-methylcytosine-specific restriction endonuclease McrA